MEFHFSASELFRLGFYLLLLIFTIHAVVFAYHWLSFGANRSSSLIGIAVYLLVGALLLVILGVSLAFI